MTKSKLKGIDRDTLLEQRINTMLGENRAGKVVGYIMEGRFSATNDLVKENKLPTSWETIEGKAIPVFKEDVDLYPDGLMDQDGNEVFGRDKWKVVFDNLEWNQDMGIETPHEAEVIVSGINRADAIKNAKLQLEEEWQDNPASIPDLPAEIVSFSVASVERT